jgi:hypothetical protein
MLARILAAALLVFAATIVAAAQLRPVPRPPAGRGFPAEKFSTRPVQATPALQADPSGSEKTQKRRWHQRSRTPLPR